MEDVEVGLRREAVRRRLAGESPEVIARELGRTRQWVGKWTARYDPDDPGWAQGRSHAARRVANRTDAEVEAQVLEVRARLEANPWAQVGAPAIAWELEKLGAVVPPERSIERILARAGATGRPRPGRRASKGIPYPAPAAKRPGPRAPRHGTDHQSACASRGAAPALDGPAGVRRAGARVPCRAGRPRRPCAPVPRSLSQDQDRAGSSGRALLRALVVAVVVAAAAVTASSRPRRVGRPRGEATAQGCRTPTHRLTKGEKRPNSRP